ncbi:MAG: hypothetical protein JW704_03530 [Anaerolineaceae bacterium]|nr:hypothetical protein [Anaerolineaceae bacterium]
MQAAQRFELTPPPPGRTARYNDIPRITHRMSLNYLGYHDPELSDKAARILEYFCGFNAMKYVEIVSPIERLLDFEAQASSRKRMSRATWCRHIKALEEAGYIGRRQFKVGENRSSMVIYFKQKLLDVVNRRSKLKTNVIELPIKTEQNTPTLSHKGTHVSKCESSLGTTEGVFLTPNITNKNNNSRANDQTIARKVDKYKYKKPKELGAGKRGLRRFSNQLCFMIRRILNDRSKLWVESLARLEIEGLDSSQANLSGVPWDEILLGWDRPDVTRANRLWKVRTEVIPLLLGMRMPESPADSLMKSAPMVEAPTNNPADELKAQKERLDKAVETGEMSREEAGELMRACENLLWKRKNTPQL